MDLSETLRQAKHTRTHPHTHTQVWCSTASDVHLLVHQALLCIVDTVALHTYRTHPSRHRVYGAYRVRYDRKHCTCVRLSPQEYRKHHQYHTVRRAGMMMCKAFYTSEFFLEQAHGPGVSPLCPGLRFDTASALRFAIQALPSARPGYYARHE